MENELDVKAIRDGLGLTQAVFATRLGVDQSTISNWEKKATAPRGPARFLLSKLAKEAASKSPSRGEAA